MVDTSKNITEIPEWFHGCQLNYAENVLKCPQQDKVALITYGKLLLHYMIYIIILHNPVLNLLIT